VTLCGSGETPLDVASCAAAATAGAAADNNNGNNGGNARQANAATATAQQRDHMELQAAWTKFLRLFLQIAAQVTYNNDCSKCCCE